MSSLSHTPINVKPRKMSFAYNQVESKDFFDDNILKSVYIAALSATFPAGEGEFIASVRLFREQIEDPKLKEEIRGFIGQEGHHSHQHKQFNKSLSALGYDAVKTEQVFERDLAKRLIGRSPKQRLAFTACLEHQTAIMAEAFLSNENLLQGMEPVIADLLLWHSVEEIEHKGVAFDVYMTCVGDRKLLHRVQKIATMIFTYHTLKYMALMLWWSRKMPKWRDIKGYMKFMFGKQGLIRSISKPYKDFFRSDFHPWDHKNQHLIDQWKAENDENEGQAKESKPQQAA